MSISKLCASLTLTATAVLAWSDRAAFAADTPMPAPMTSAFGTAAQVSVGAPGCATCEHGVPAAGCTSCGRKLLSGQLLHKNTHASASLCPGACFGYFQTQWRKWDEVCPYPYSGTGTGNNSAPPTGPFFPPNMTPPGTSLPTPRPVDPKMVESKKVGINSGSDLPVIPVPSNKFGP